MRKKINYMILSLLGVSGLISIISVCVIAAGCGTIAGTKIQETEETTVGGNTKETEETVEKPPSLEVIYSENGEKENSITLSSGDASWEVRRDGDMAESTVYCGVHPLDMDFESATISLDPEQSMHVLELNFEVEPDSWEVVSVWKAEDEGSTDSYENGMRYDSTADFKDDSHMEAWAGDYIYEIKAVWDRETYGGEAHYSFMTVCDQIE